MASCICRLKRNQRRKHYEKTRTQEMYGSESNANNFAELIKEQALVYYNSRCFSKGKEVPFLEKVLIRFFLDCAVNDILLERIIYQPDKILRIATSQGVRIIFKNGSSLCDLLGEGIHSSMVGAVRSLIRIDQYYTKHPQEEYEHSCWTFQDSKNPLEIALLTVYEEIRERLKKNTRSPSKSLISSESRKSFVKSN